MNRFYFSYGTDPCFPFYRGWTMVVAADKAQAIAIFRAAHPDNTPGIVNCAFIYTEEWFKKSEMYSGKYPEEVCHEILMLTQINMKTNP